MMSSSGNVMNFRLDPLVREIKNILFEGVTGMTTWTAASTLFTSSKNFCFPSSISSMLHFPLHVILGMKRVARTWDLSHPPDPTAPRRGFPQAPAAGPHTGRGAKPDGLVRDRTRSLHLATSACQQLFYFRDNHIRSRQFHIPHALPANHTLLINHIDVRNELAATVELVGHLPGIK